MIWGRAVWFVTGFLHKKWLYLNTKFDYEWELDNTNWDDMQIMTLDLGDHALRAAPLYCVRSVL